MSIAMVSREALAERVSAAKQTRARLRLAANRARENSAI